MYCIILWSCHFLSPTLTSFDDLRNCFRVRALENKVCEKFNVKYALACSSGSAALFIALKALGVGPGDEVITQAFTFVATVEAILMCGATPIITEVDNTYNMDPNDLHNKMMAMKFQYLHYQNCLYAFSHYFH